MGSHLLKTLISWQPESSLYWHKSIPILLCSSTNSSLAGSEISSQINQSRLLGIVRSGKMSISIDSSYILYDA